MGLQPSELRLAHFKDLDIKKRTLFVRHSKGDESWASAETVDIIRQDMLPFVERFVAERKRHLIKADIGEALALFLNMVHGANGFYSMTGFRRVKSKVEHLSGVEFRLKDIRSTLSSMTVNGDLRRLPVMSAQLRHSTTTTTQQSYFRMEQGVAGKQLKDAWKERPIRTPKTPAIESGFDNTGYV